MAMTLLKERLQSDLTAALRAGDEVRLATIRMALAAITTAEVAGKTARTLTEDEVVTVLGREAKKRREAAQAYDEAGRPELATRERAELGVLEEYLPAPLSDQELDGIVAAAVAQARAQGAEGPAAMGVVMKLVQPQIGGRADGGVVAARVKQQHHTCKAQQHRCK